MEIGLRVPLDGEVVREGAVVLPARLLVDVVRALPGDGVVARAAPGRAGRRARRRHRRRSTSARCAGGLPAVPGAGGDGRSRSRGRRSSRPFCKVARSASRDETRPVLTGILVSAGGRGAADGRDRLLPPGREGDALGPLDGEFEANVPARALQELTRIVQHGAAEQLAVSVRANQVVFEAAGACFLAADRRPVPQLPPTAARRLRARAPAGRRGDHRRRAPHLAAGAEERAAAARFADGELTVSAARRTSARRARRAGAVPGRALEIGSNPSSCAMGSRRRGRRRGVKLISPLRPGLIQAAHGSGFQYLLMPIRLNV